jgi:hypothetical protein
MKRLLAKLRRLAGTASLRNHVAKDFVPEKTG